MRVPAYERYRDSEVEWLGAIPDHWSVLPGRRLFKQTRIPALPGDEQLSSTQRFGVIPQALFMSMEGQKVVLAMSGTDAFKHVDKDDFVISLRSFQGGIERCRFDGCVSPAYTVLKPVDGVVPGYWEYALKCTPYIAALQSVTDGIREGKTVRYEQFGTIPAPLPPPDEQAAIVAFLDHETGKIDALVEAQQRLIELLKEKRQAVISHAVTKGLDPTAPMKDSGVEWPGAVPAHWDFKPLKRIATSYCDGPFGSALKSEHYVDEGARVVRLQNIKVEGFDDTDAAFVDIDYFRETLARHEVMAGDILIAGLGDDRNSVGRACVAPEGISPALVKADCFCFRLFPEQNPHFVSAQLSAGAGFSAGTQSSGSTRSRIPASTMAEIRVALPPYSEQAAISAWLRERTDNFNILTSEAEAAITLLRER